MLFEWVQQPSAEPLNYKQPERIVVQSKSWESAAIEIGHILISQYGNVRNKTVRLWEQDGERHATGCPHVSKSFTLESIQKIKESRRSHATLNRFLDPESSYFPPFS